ncbi:MAG: rhomboid family intramembrane serine protease [Myxococcota bacterium]
MSMRMTPVVKRILIANIAIWLLFALLINFGHLGWARSLYDDQLALDPRAAVFELKLWQIFTYSWLHDLNAPMHILGNMLGLFFLGPALETRWGPRDFLIFYLATGVIAGIFTVMVGLAMPGLFGLRVVGASGSVMGLLAGFSFAMPTATLLLFFIIPMQARWVIWLALGIDTIFFFSNPDVATVAWHTHLGGVIGAWLLITGRWRPGRLLDRLRLARLKSRRRTLDVIHGGKSDRHHLN